MARNELRNKGGIELVNSEVKVWSDGIVEFIVYDDDGEHVTMELDKGNLEHLLYLLNLSTPDVPDGVGELDATDNDSWRKWTNDVKQANEEPTDDCLSCGVELVGNLCLNAECESL